MTVDNESVQIIAGYLNHARQVSPVHLVNNGGVENTNEIPEFYPFGKMLVSQWIRETTDNKEWTELI